MKNKLVILSLGVVLFLSTTTRLYGQQKAPEDSTIKKVQAAKSLTGWDILSNLYQLSLNDVTATSKSVSFKSTIFGLIKNNNQKVNAVDYQHYSIERYLQPYLNFDYKNNFNPSNLSLGITWSFINANDVTRSKVFNSYNKDLSDRQAEIDAFVDPIITKLTNNQPPNYQTIIKHLATFEKSMDSSDLTDDLKKILPQEAITKIEAMKNKFDDANRNVANRFNVTFTPEISYAFNRSGVQGASFLLNAIKGFTIFAKLSTQFTLKTGYVLGDDTVIKAIDMNKHLFENQLSLNQVIANKMIKGSDGKSNLSPCVELAINYGYNYLTSGYTAGQQRDESSLGAKFGILVGSSSWVVLPVTYNYATKKTVTSISLKVNLGDPPFKSSTK